MRGGGKGWTRLSEGWLGSSGKKGGCSRWGCGACGSSMGRVRRSQNEGGGQRLCARAPAIAAAACERVEDHVLVEASLVGEAKLKVAAHLDAQGREELAVLHVLVEHVQPGGVYLGAGR